MARAEALQRRVVQFIRAFGLLRPDRTPCGRPIGISAAHALTELREDAPLTQAELGARLRLEKSTVSRLVTDLEGRGWVGRERDPADGRMVRLRLTAGGRRVTDEVSAARAALFARLVARIPAGEQEAVERALDVLVRAIDPSDDMEEAGDETTLLDRRGGAARGRRDDDPAARAAAGGDRCSGGRHAVPIVVRRTGELVGAGPDRSGD